MRGPVRCYNYFKADSKVQSIDLAVWNEETDGNWSTCSQGKNQLLFHRTCLYFYEQEQLE